MGEVSSRVHKSRALISECLDKKKDGIREEISSMDYYCLLVVISFPFSVDGAATVSVRSLRAMH